jgi:hypothetical protein
VNPVEVISTGRRNTNSGPDFFNAKIQTDDTLWAGNVEIHKKASDWEKHHHSADKAYENVILHVVETADKQIFRENQTEIATLELKWPEQLILQLPQAARCQNLDCLQRPAAPDRSGHAPAWLQSG